MKKEGKTERVFICLLLQGRIANKSICSLQALAPRANVQPQTEPSIPYRPFISPERMTNQPSSNGNCKFISAQKFGGSSMVSFMIVKTPHEFQVPTLVQLDLEHFEVQPCTNFPKSLNNRSRSSSACMAKHKWMLNPHQLRLIRLPMALL